MEACVLSGQTVVVTGGTGSLGKCLVKRLLAGEMGDVSRVVVFSRDEAKQHKMRLESHGWGVSTDEVIYGDRQGRLQFVVGDVRDYAAVLSAFRGANVIIHAAAMKQVPTCEYHPEEAIKTNILGPANIVRAARSDHSVVHTVLGVSTDKCVKAVNCYGMTKALMERLFGQANLDCRCWPGGSTRYFCVRYGNVLASTGSVVPLFRRQIKQGGPVTITDPEMTRFFFTIDQAVDTVFAALKGAESGEVWVPKLPSVRMTDVANALIGDREIGINYTGIRPGEKLHEILISEEELRRVSERSGHYVVGPILPELGPRDHTEHPLEREYSSGVKALGLLRTTALLKDAGLLEDDA
jgi:FlaA1/EpsC-like NDP-sugar epimerase